HRGAAGVATLAPATPGLPAAGAAWVPAALVGAPGSRWRPLAWFSPAATTLVVLASANHFLLDAVGGLAVAGVGVLAASQPSWWRAMITGRGWWLAAATGYTALACCVSSSAWANPPPPATVGRAHRLPGEA